MACQNSSNFLYGPMEKKIEQQRTEDKSYPRHFFSSSSPEGESAFLFGVNFWSNWSIIASQITHATLINWKQSRHLTRSRKAKPSTRWVDQLLAIHHQNRHLFIFRPLDLFLINWIHFHNFVRYIIVVQECWDSQNKQTSRESNPIKSYNNRIVILIIT